MGAEGGAAAMGAEGGAAETAMPSDIEDAAVGGPSKCQIDSLQPDLALESERKPRGKGPRGKGPQGKGPRGKGPQEGGKRGKGPRGGGKRGKGPAKGYMKTHEKRFSPELIGSSLPTVSEARSLQQHSSFERRYQSSIVEVVKAHGLSVFYAPGRRIKFPAMMGKHYCDGKPVELPFQEAEILHSQRGPSGVHVIRKGLSMQTVRSYQDDASAMAAGVYPLIEPIVLNLDLQCTFNVQGSGHRFSHIIGPGKNVVISPNLTSLYYHIHPNQVEVMGTTYIIHLHPYSWSRKNRRAKKKTTEGGLTFLVHRLDCYVSGNVKAEKKCARMLPEQLDQKVTSLFLIGRSQEDLVRFTKVLSEKQSLLLDTSHELSEQPSSKFWPKFLLAVDKVMPSRPVVAEKKRSLTGRLKGLTISESLPPELPNMPPEPSAWEGLWPIHAALVAIRNLRICYDKFQFRYLPSQWTLFVDGEKSTWTSEKYDGTITVVWKFTNVIVAQDYINHRNRKARWGPVNLGYVEGNSFVLQKKRPEAEASFLEMKRGKDLKDAEGDSEQSQPTWAKKRRTPQDPSAMAVEMEPLTRRRSSSGGEEDVDGARGVVSGDDKELSVEGGRGEEEGRETESASNIDMEDAFTGPDSELPGGIEVFCGEQQLLPEGDTFFWNKVDAVLRTNHKESF